MNIALTGAEGGFGAAFLAVAGAKGTPCVGLSRRDADLSKPDEVFSAITRVKPDVVVHAAAMTAVDLCENEKDLAWAVNVEGTRAVTAASKACGARLAYISTDYVFDGEKEGAYTPADAPNPLNVYGVTKLEGEKIILTLPGSVVVRTSWLYSKKGKSFVNTVLGLAAKGGAIKMVNDQLGAPTYASDFAAAVLTILEKGGTGIYHVANSGYCTWFEYARKILDLTGANGIEVVPITAAELNRPARRPKNSRLDCSRYVQLSGAPLRHWRDALAEMLR